MNKAFSFEKEFEQFENNSKIQDQIISILQSRDPKLFGRWVANEEDQKKGIDLVVYKEFTLFHVELEGFNHPHGVVGFFRPGQAGDAHVALFVDIR